MAHYAFLDENGLVTEVIAGKDEGEEGIDWEAHYGNFRGQRCKRTSYHMHAGKHKLGKEPFRKNFATIGGTYDEARDAFIPPAPPFPSWTVDDETCRWKPPIPMPADGEPTPGQKYFWDEERLNWIPYDWDEETQTYIEKVITTSGNGDT